MRKRRQKVPREKTEAKGRRKKKKKRVHLLEVESRPSPLSGAPAGARARDVQEKRPALMWKGDMLNHYTIGAGGRAGGAGPEANP